MQWREGSLRPYVHKPVQEHAQRKFEGQLNQKIVSLRCGMSVCLGPWYMSLKRTEVESDDKGLQQGTHVQRVIAHLDQREMILSTIPTLESFRIITLESFPTLAPTGNDSKHESKPHQVSNNRQSRK